MIREFTSHYEMAVQLCQKFFLKNLELGKFLKIRQLNPPAYSQRECEGKELLFLWVNKINHYLFIILSQWKLLHFRF